MSVFSRKLGKHGSEKNLYLENFQSVNSIDDLITLQEIHTLAQN